MHKLVLWVTQLPLWLVMVGSSPPPLQLIRDSALRLAKCYVAGNTNPHMCSLNHTWNASSLSPIELVCTKACTSWKEWVEICSCLWKSEANQEIDKIVESVSLPAPVLHCRDDVTISLTWSPNPFSNGSQQGFIFILEIQRKGSPWKAFNITKNFFSVVENLEANSEYRFRIRRVGVGLIEISPESEWIRTFPSLTEELPAGTLRHVKEITSVVPYSIFSNFTAGVRIGWTPSDNRTCWYSVLKIPLHKDNDKPPLPLNLYMAGKPFEVELKGLKLGEDYKIKIFSLERNWSHSAQGDAPFFKVEPINFTLTAPTSQLVQVRHTVKEADQNGHFRLDVHVTWKSLAGGIPSNVTVFAQSDLGYTKKATVPGINQEVTLYNVTVRRNYSLEVVTSPEDRPSEIRRDKPSGSSAMIVAIFVGVAAAATVLVVFRWYPSKQVAVSNASQPSSSLPLVCQQALAVHDEWEIDRKELVIGEEIGRGAFGTVHRAAWKRPTGVVEVAAKRLRSDPMSDDAQQFRAELEIMKGVDKHSNVLALLGCVTRPEYGSPFEQLLIVEYCALGDLQGFLRRAWKRMFHQASAYVSVDSTCIQYAELLSHVDTSSGVEDSASECEYENISPEPLPFAVSNQTYRLYLDGRGTKSSRELVVTPADLLNFARQVAIGMEFLSSARVVHRDLAARNVLVCADRSVKISDFGLSRDIYEQNVYKKAGAERIPVKWMAIESLMHQIYTSQSDVWSFGILLWEIATLGGSPYPSISNDSLFELLTRGYRMERPATCGQEFYQLMRDCWAADPMDRPTFAQLKQRLDALLEAAAPHHYIHIDQLFAEKHS